MSDIHVSITKTVEVSGEHLRHIPYEGFLKGTVEFSKAVFRYDYTDGVWHCGRGTSYAHRIKKNGEPYNESIEWPVYLHRNPEWAALIEQHMPTEHVVVTIDGEVVR
jgi:hypothetical protein